ncbi:hypothetical protein HispidOSU_020204 [Sigmodon hispidus]
MPASVVFLPTGSNMSDSLLPVPLAVRGSRVFAEQLSSALLGHGRSCTTRQGTIISHHHTNVFLRLTGHSCRSTSNPRIRDSGGNGAEDKNRDLPPVVHNRWSVARGASLVAS